MSLALKIALAVISIAETLAKQFGADANEVKNEVVKNCKIDGAASDAVAAKIDAALPGG